MLLEKGDTLPRQFPEGMNKTKGTCFVVALTHFLDLPFQEVYDLVCRYDAGVDRGKGIHRYSGEKLLKELNLQKLKVWYGKTFVTFCKYQPIGRYLVQTQGHITCVIDGVPLDSAGTGACKRIQGVWSY